MIDTVEAAIRAAIEKVAKGGDPEEVSNDVFWAVMEPCGIETGDVSGMWYSGPNGEEFEQALRDGDADHIREAMREYLSLEFGYCDDVTKARITAFREAL